MLAGARARRRVVERARMSARQGDDLLQRPRGERSRYHEKVGALREYRNTGEIAQRVRRVLVQGQVDRERRAVEKKRVAVGRRPGDVLVGDIGAGAGLVLDDHLLAEKPGQRGGEQPGIDVDASSRREADHQPQRPGRERLARRQAGVQEEQRENECLQPANPNPPGITLAPWKPLKSRREASPRPRSSGCTGWAPTGTTSSRSCPS